MKQNVLLSRRAALPALVASPLLGVTLLAAEVSSADARLLALGQDFDRAAARLDYAIADKADVDWRVLDELARLDAEIVATQATTVAGLRVKARAACWSLLGDLDPSGQATTDKRMALSIVRDLIRLYDPSLEQPDALKKLVEDATNCASHSAT